MLETNEELQRRASYTRWVNMMDRCYGDSVTETYRDVRVCKEWKDFDTFHEWHKENNDPNRKLELDKDLLVFGNKLYSPDACVLVPKELNMLIVIPRVEKQRTLPGTYKTAFNYGASCNGIKLGFYDTEEEAHRAWQMDMIRQLLVWSKVYEETNPRLSSALLNRFRAVKQDVSIGAYTRCL